MKKPLIKISNFYFNPDGDIEVIFYNQDENDAISVAQDKTITIRNFHWWYVNEFGSDVCIAELFLVHDTEGMRKIIERYLNDYRQQPTTLQQAKEAINSLLSKLSHAK